MTHSAKSIANYFIDLANSNGQHLSPMKLQKLVYYAHGWYAGHTGQPLINESVEAWEYGPVIPTLYHEFKRYGSGPIRSKATSVEGNKLREVDSPSDANLRTYLDNIWKSYGQYTALKLSEMTHAANGPWDVTRRSSVGVKGVDIPFHEIAAHFRTAIENSKKGIQGHS